MGRNIAISASRYGSTQTNESLSIPMTVTEMHNGATCEFIGFWALCCFRDGRFSRPSLIMGDRIKIGWRYLFHGYVLDVHVGDLPRFYMSSSYEIAI